MKTWKACDHGDYGDNEGQCIAIIGDDKRVALVLGPDTPETRKNADLISAAPELLEALRDLLAERYALEEPEQFDASGNWTSDSPASVKARLAIAKATGDQ